MNNAVLTIAGVLVYALVVMFAYGLFSQCAKSNPGKMSLLWPVTIPLLLVFMGIVWINSTVALVSTSVRGWGERIGSRVNNWILRRRIMYAPLAQGDDGSA